MAKPRCDMGNASFFDDTRCRDSPLHSFRKLPFFVHARRALETISRLSDKSRRHENFSFAIFLFCVEYSSGLRTSYYQLLFDHLSTASLDLKSQTPSAKQSRPSDKNPTTGKWVFHILVLANTCACLIHVRLLLVI
ncbi:hypothetical protein GGR51DRAFT_237139 [Nemania sp. FL0031]|nr:hypothetical protein GGR51DRAFT_237139 [Nemania sp. FL0031]